MDPSAATMLFPTTTATTTLLVLLLLCASSCLSVVEAGECGQGGAGHRVVGGSEAMPNNWPWQVSLSRNGWHTCGGTIIAPSWILSAAHCFQGKFAEKEPWLVSAGEHDLNAKSGLEVRRKVARIIVHPGFQGVSKGNDVALVKLDAPLKYGKGVAPACMPKANTDWDRKQRNCMLTGWGLTMGEQNKNKLQQVGGPIVDQRECGRVWLDQLKDSMICFGTGLKGGCRGDSGGPLVCYEEGKWTHVGIVSFGNGKCKVDGFPTIFTRVSSFKTWIDKVIDVYGGPDGSGPEPEPPKGVIGPNCVSSKGCSFFAKNGCKGNGWLLTSCPKDCGICLPCGDKDVDCGERAAKGDCHSTSEKTQAYMYLNCNHSCKLCQ